MCARSSPDENGSYARLALRISHKGERFVLTQVQNDRLSRVGPGTPGGELMRRYWHPVAAVAQMKDKFTMPVRLLGEDLILYKDRGGVYGLIDPFFPHRRMNMIYGIPDDAGLRCPYHGWGYD